jgi:hypothetical protein
MHAWGAVCAGGNAVQSWGRRRDKHGPLKVQARGAFEDETNARVWGRLVSRSLRSHSKCVREMHGPHGTAVVNGVGSERSRGVLGPQGGVSEPWPDRRRAQQNAPKEIILLCW